MTTWVQAALEEWGTWLRTKGAGQGWGGAVDLDRLFELARAPRNAGEHSDPVLAEVCRTAYDGQDQAQRIDRYVKDCEPELRLVGRLRYAGVLEAVDIPGPRDQHKLIVDVEALAGCGGFVLAIDAWMSETHGLAVSKISELMGSPQSTVYDRLDRLHERIRAELLQDARTRKSQGATRREAA